VLSFSQAIAQELDGTGVTSTALCPGAVSTGFIATGDLDGIKVFDKAASAESVAECGYEAMLRGELVKINEKGLHFLLNWVVPFLPRKVVLKISQKTMEKIR
jgi:short-subunit dehydrogenase